MQRLSSQCATMSDEAILDAFRQGRFDRSMRSQMARYLHTVTTPIAVRSSSLLEDSPYQPFAGVYATIMLPNNHPSLDVRLAQLLEGIKVVYASTYMRAARDLFECGDSYDHQQGLGWYWILQADLTNAGMLSGEPAEVLAMAQRALEILEPIENWPGVARAYAARAAAHAQLGEEEAAAYDRLQQQAAESKLES